jgi:hypothetical protein
MRRPPALEIPSPKGVKLDPSGYDSSSHQRPPSSTPNSKHPTTPVGINNPGLEKRKNATPTVRTPIITTAWTDEEYERQYDLTPVSAHTDRKSRKQPTPSYTIDPFEFSQCSESVVEESGA